MSGNQHGCHNEERSNRHGHIAHCGTAQDPPYCFPRRRPAAGAGTEELAAEMQAKEHRAHEKVAVDPDETWSILLLDPPQTIATLTALDAATMSMRAPVLEHLIADYPDSLRTLFEWALDNPAEIPATRLHSWDGVDRFVIRMLGEVGDESTAARLHAHTLDPDLADAAVKAIRQIRRGNAR